MIRIDRATVDRVMSWPALFQALEAGHRRPPPHLQDVLIRPQTDSLFVRSAWVEGLGPGLKAVTVKPNNPSATPPRPSVQGEMLLFDEITGAPLALVDGVALTAWKTAGDSAFGARLLAPPDARTLLMVGAGAMAAPLIAAHRAARPALTHLRLWNRSPARVQALHATLRQTLPDLDIQIAPDLALAAREADVICCATMSQTPILQGAWITPGTHVDLVGAFTPQMREADDTLLRRGELFVDYRGTTVGEIGELIDPMARGVITAQDVLADLYDLVAGRHGGRRGPESITVYKNGGGAHLDLMTAHCALHLAQSTAH